MERGVDDDNDRALEEERAGAVSQSHEERAGWEGEEWELDQIC